MYVCDVQVSGGGVQRRVREGIRRTTCLLGVNKGRRKKSYFFVGPATKALPPPIELSGPIFLGILFLELKKKLFFLSGKAKTFLRLPLFSIHIKTSSMSKTTS